MEWNSGHLGRIPKICIRPCKHDPAFFAKRVHGPPIETSECRSYQVAKMESIALEARASEIAWCLRQTVSTSCVKPKLCQRPRVMRYGIVLPSRNRTGKKDECETGHARITGQVARCGKCKATRYNRIMQPKSEKVLDSPGVLHHYQYRAQSYRYDGFPNSQLVLLADKRQYDTAAMCHP